MEDLSFLLLTLCLQNSQYHRPFGRLRCILLTFCVHFVNKMFQNVQQNAYRHECIFYLLISHPNRLRSTIVLAKCQVLLMQKYIFAYILLAKCSKMFTNTFLHHILQSKMHNLQQACKNVNASSVNVFYRVKNITFFWIYFVLQNQMA